MQKGKNVLYVDSFGVEHDALVTAVNGLNLGFVTLVYVDMKAPEASNLITKFDVPHVSDKSQDENNPALPRYTLNVWKDAGEEHKAPPADHPIFDHPAKKPDIDQDGNPIQVERPLYEAEVAAHEAPAPEPDVTAALDAAGPAPADDTTAPSA